MKEQKEHKQNRLIEVYTDGSSLNNGKVNSSCGWACKLIYQRHQLIKSGGDIGKTNNQMEMIAVLEAMKSITDKTIPVIVYSDSTYVVETLKGNYIISANTELWRLLMEEKKKFSDIEFIWIKGHGKNKHNNEVNDIAVVEARRMNNKQKAALNLKEDIEKACIKRGLNLTIYAGKIGFVDKQEGKIIMLWNSEYKLNKK